MCAIVFVLVVAVLSYLIYIFFSYIEYKEIIKIKSSSFLWRNLNSLTKKWLIKKGYEVEYCYAGQYYITKKHEK